MSDNIQFIPEEELAATFEVSILSETTDWGLIQSGVPDAHKHTQGAGIKVAVLDTGIANHDDLNPNVISVHGFTGGNTDDKVGHGTHVSGTIAACANGFGVIGVAPQAQIISIKVLDDSGRGGYANIINGIRKAIELGADVINMSLGSPSEAPRELHEVVKEAYARGIILVAAAGNDAGAVNYPARYDEVIAVAAMDQDGNMARFSSRGSQISVGAPGVNVYSTHLNNGYAVLNGTSQASPFIAGVCALALAYTRAHPTLPQIKSGVDMLRFLDMICDPFGRIASGKDGEFGFGIPKFGNLDWTKF